MPERVGARCTPDCEKGAAKHESDEIAIPTQRGQGPQAKARLNGGRDGSVVPVVLGPSMCGTCAAAGTVTMRRTHSPGIIKFHLTQRSGVHAG
jgi:hypothetical protein